MPQGWNDEGLIGDSREWLALRLGDKSRGLDPDRLVRVLFVVHTNSGDQVSADEVRRKYCMARQSAALQLGGLGFGFGMGKEEQDTQGVEHRAYRGYQDLIQLERG